MPIRKGKKLHFGSRKVEGAWGHGKPFRAGEDGFPHSCWEKEGFVNGGLGLVILAEKPGGEAHLGIEIYGQDLSSHFRKGAERETTAVVFPTPPFWLATARIGTFCQYTRKPSFRNSGLLLFAFCLHLFRKCQIFNFTRKPVFNKAVFRVFPTPKGRESGHRHEPRNAPRANAGGSHLACFIESRAGGFGKPSERGGLKGRRVEAFLIVASFPLFDRVAKMQKSGGDLWVKGLFPCS